MTLEKKQKNRNRVFWLGLVVLIIILLYMLYCIIFNHSVGDEPASILPKKQVITEVDYFYKTDAPQIDKNAVEHINLHDIGYQTTEDITHNNMVDPISLGLIDEDAKNEVVIPEKEVTVETVDTVDSEYLYAYYEDRTWRWWQDTYSVIDASSFYDFTGVDPFYMTKEEIAQCRIPNDTIYFWESLVELFNSQQRKVIASETDLDIPNLTVPYTINNNITNREVPNVVGQVNFLFDSENRYIYSARTAESIDKSKIADVIVKYDYTVECYDGVDASAIKSAIHNALTNETYGDAQKRLWFTTGEERKEAMMNIVIDAIASVSSEYSITLNSLVELNTAGGVAEELSGGFKNPNEVFNTCEHTVNDKGQVIIGADTIPEKVTKVNITDYEILYDELACAYHYGWY